MSEQGHNSTAGLKPIVERIEKVNEEIKEQMEFRSDIFKEAKSNGWDVKALRTIIRLRAADPEDVARQEEILDTYKHALGMLA